jgi:hypothetical protein
MSNESNLPPIDERRFAVTVNGQVFRLHDPEPSTRQLLDLVGLQPADECILIQGFAHGTVAKGLDENIDLRTVGTEVFYAFRSDRIFRFTVNERGFDWGQAEITEPVLRAVAHVGDEETFLLERQDEPDQELHPDSVVRLGHAGTEHLRTVKKTVTVYFKDVAYELPRGEYTTEQLMAQFPIEQGYLLNLLKDDGELVTLKPSQKTTLKDGMQFFSQPPGGGAS